MAISIYFIVVMVLFTSGISAGTFDRGISFDTRNCSLSSSTLAEIRSYKTIANNIFKEATQNSFRGKTYSDLRAFVRSFGPRPSGSLQLELALVHLRQKLTSLRLTNIKSENVNVPKLLRTVEHAKIIFPREQEIKILGTGTTISTPIAGITKEIYFIKPTDSITKAVSNKIVAFDDISANTSSWETVYRHGAAGILFRAFVSGSPSAIYASRGESVDKRIVKIPVASITNKDMDLLRQLAGQSSKVTLLMNIQQQLSSSISRNVWGDLKGRTKPEEVVIVSGHADSWDLSESASDDGLGVILSYQVSSLLQKLKLFPKRTIRTVFWTGEEFGLVGSEAYARKYAPELNKLNTVLEPDKGCFGLSGFLFGGPTEYGCILHEILKLMEDTIGPMKLHRTETSSNASIPSMMKMATDVASFFPAGVPGAELDGDTMDHKYYTYHHTPDDTMRVVSSKLLDQCLALLASTSYVFADMNNMMPRIVN